MLSPLPQEGLEEGVLWERRWEDVTRTALLADIKPQVPLHLRTSDSPLLNLQ